MSEYRLEPFDVIKNSQQYTYYRLFINGSCQLDDFEERVNKNPVHRKQYLSIIANMEFISDRHMLTSKKFNHIKGVGRNDVYEFKSKDLRIYVVKKSPDMYIIIGGFKVEQDRDIKLLKDRLQGFNL